MSFWTTMFAIIGCVFVIAVVYYIIRKVWSGDGTSKKTIDFPSDSYMRTIGGFCPDYWSVGKRSKDKHECINRFNIPIHKGSGSESCLDKNGKNTITFNTIKKWPPKKKNIRKMCSWIDNCGPRSNVRASWIGMDRVCSNNEM